MTHAINSPAAPGTASRPSTRDIDYVERQAIEAFRRHGYDVRGKNIEDLMSDLRNRRARRATEAGALPVGSSAAGTGEA